MDNCAVVLLSGGLDSATTLAIAREQGYACHALSFDYGQRHKMELDAARSVAKALGAAKHVVMTIDLRAFGGSALTDEKIAVPKDRPGVTQAEAHGLQSVGVGERAERPSPQPSPKGRGDQHIPVTYVPARNTIFLSFALGLAEVLDAADIFIGVNAVDYSGYPDCRPEFVRAFETMANLATRMTVEGRRITVHTPLIALTKAQIIRRGLDLGVDYGQTFSCYDPVANGEPCGHCDACLLRAAGFKEAGVYDPAASDER